MQFVDKNYCLRIRLLFLSSTLMPRKGAGLVPVNHDYMKMFVLLQLFPVYSCKYKLVTAVHSKKTTL